MVLIARDMDPREGLQLLQEEHSSLMQIDRDMGDFDAEHRRRFAASIMRDFGGSDIFSPHNPFVHLQRSD